MVINGDIPSGKRWHSYGKSPSLIESTISMGNGHVDFFESKYMV